MGETRSGLMVRNVDLGLGEAQHSSPRSTSE